MAVRNLLKKKGFSILNITGLAIGIGCCILTALYVSHEWSYDRFFPKRDRIVRVTQTSISPSKEEPYASVPFLVAPSLEQEYPALIDKSVRFYNLLEEARTITWREGDRAFSEERFFFADSTVLGVFDLEVTAGDPEHALDEPLSMVLTEETARRYFGEEEAIGKTLRFKGVFDFTVTAVVQDLPGNTHFPFDILASFSSLPTVFQGQDYESSWYSNPVWTYLLLEEGVDREQLESRLPEFAEKYYHPHRPEGERVELDLQPLTDIHLHSAMGQEIMPNGSWYHVQLFSAIALLVLVIACINFMNLSTARSMERAREVGMRKAVGADRSQLFRQFMGESLLMTGIAVCISVLLVKALLPFFNNFFGMNLTFGLAGNPWLIPGLLGVTLAVGGISGLYPSLFLSGLEPVRILRNSGGSTRSGTLLRKSLVVFQFSLSVVLIICTAIIYLQLNHMQSRDSGFNEEQIVILPISQTLTAWEFESFRTRLQQEPSIGNVAGSSYILGSDEEDFYKYRPARGNGSESNSNPVLHVTFDFIETYDIHVVAGRGFSRDHPTDAEQAVMINERMLQQLPAETPAEAIGEQFYYDAPGGEQETYTVIGVTADFNHSSVKKEIGPLLMRVVDGMHPIVIHIEYAAVNVAAGQTAEALEALEQAWEEVNFVDPFRYRFHREELNSIYRSEMQMAGLSGTFTLLCILVACLGLFGLASYTISLRTREIGLRKTLGASVTGIVRLLSTDYLRLIILSNLIAWPAAWYLAGQWLQNFPYRITLDWNMGVVFLLAAGISLLICVLTVSFQSVRAALMNPVESIGRE